MAYRPTGKIQAVPILLSDSMGQTKLDCQSPLSVTPAKPFIVKAEWFWITLQAGYASELDYLYVSTPAAGADTGLPHLEGHHRAETSSEASIDGQPIKRSMRQNHFFEFLQTESNYVGILEAVLTLYKKPLEEMAQGDNPMLNKSQLRTIFGALLPIHAVYKLEILEEIHGRWSERCNLVLAKTLSKTTSSVSNGLAVRAEKPFPFGSRPKFTLRAVLN